MSLHPTLIRPVVIPKQGPLFWLVNGHRIFLDNFDTHDSCVQFADLDCLSICYFLAFFYDDNGADLDSVTQDSVLLRFSPYIDLARR